MRLEKDLDDVVNKDREQIINHPQFIEHPNDAFISSKNPVMVQCVAKNAHKTLIECNAKVREDARSSISIVLYFKFYFFS